MTLFFLLLLAGSLAGQALTGLALFSDAQRSNGGQPISLGRYLTSSDFTVDVAENWQSEYPQFAL